MFDFCFCIVECIWMGSVFIDWYIDGNWSFVCVFMVDNFVIILDVANDFVILVSMVAFV